MASLKTRLLRNGAAGIYGLGIYAFGQVISIPVFMVMWGAACYGEWQVLIAIPSYLALADIGIGQVGANQMAMSYSAGERRRAESVLHTMWLFQCAITAALALGSLAAFFLLPWPAWLGLAAVPAADVASLLWGLLLYVLLNMQIQPLSAIFRAEGVVARAAMVNHSSRLVEILVTLNVVLYGGGPLAVVAAMCAVRLFALAWFWLEARRRFSLRVGFRAASRAEFRALLAPGAGHLGLGLAQSFQLQGITLVIKSVLGAEAVTAFNVSRTLTRIPMQIAQLMNGAIYPEFSRLVGEGVLVKARTLHRLVLEMAAAITIPLTMMACFWGSGLIRGWTVNEVTVGAGLLLVLNLSVAINSTWNASSIVLTSTNRHATLGIIYTAASFGCLVLAYGFALWFGLAGPALALTVLELCMAAYVLPRSCRVIGDGAGAVLRDVATLASLRRYVSLQLFPRQAAT